MGGGPYKKEKKAMWRRRQRLERCVYSSRNAKGCWRAPEAGEEQGRDAPSETPQWKQPCDTPTLRTSGPQNWERITDVAWSHHVCDWSQQPSEANTLTLELPTFLILKTILRDKSIWASTKQNVWWACSKTHKQGFRGNESSELKVSFIHLSQTLFTN